jgi:hypothetical protein
MHVTLTHLEPTTLVIFHFDLVGCCCSTLLDRGGGIQAGLFSLAIFYTGMDFSFFSIHEHSLCSLSQQLALVFSWSVHFQRCYMNEFRLCIGYLQGFGFLWWLYLNHGIEKEVWCLLLCIVVRIFFMEKNIVGKLSSLSCLLSLFLVSSLFDKSVSLLLTCGLYGHSAYHFGGWFSWLLCRMPWSLLCEC